MEGKAGVGGFKSLRLPECVLVSLVYETYHEGLNTRLRGVLGASVFTAQTGFTLLLGREVN